MDDKNKKEPFIDKARTFLNNNKIFFEVFFETVAAVLLSFMAIILSYYQIKTAEEANRISKLSVLPRFKISAHQVKSSETSDSYDEDIMLIENNGAPIFNFRVNSAIQLHVEVVTPPPSDKIEKDLFLNMYYGGNAYTANTQGLLVTLNGYKNNLKYANLNRSFRESLSNKGDYYGNADINRFIKITYDDLFEDSHEEYYYVPLIYGASKIDKEKGFAIFKHAKQEKNLEFDSLTAEKLISILEIYPDTLNK